ncbi:DNA topoisomerase IV subunit A [Clostridium sp. UBA4548]|uniref:DNA topoisomerase IV subunit A n=1 Tax=Clostridium sp. UBA4548 TaxID=1946361 RepID=UPI0025C1AFFB|nr:DNA topoisomerase IV subunit A [Clostridium sp. UBA4548]
MAKKKDNIPVDNNIINVSIDEAMPDNYLPYAVEVSKDRALPDVRDGMKPVHRRILYGAYMLKAFPDKPYYKSARIVGDILGKYHPHGDTSVYDAMVILAQDFSTRKPLIDGHGNWGSIDGDSAAAMRYTEARLSNIALEMLRDIDKDVVDMVNNYSDSEKEPSVLPSRYPNLLVNGAFGIAVGLATNIPPHNLGEVIDASLALADNPEITTKELMNYIKGPDLPTGGILIGKNSMISAYETGEGKVTLRAKTNIETLENGRLGIVITEFPYRKNKAKLLQAISDMTGDKKHAKALETIADIRDESDRNGIRAVIEFKKSANEDGVNKVLKYLYKRTELQCNISFNMVALANGKPRTMGLKALLHYYVEHQKEIVTRRTKKELETAEKRFHIVQGFIKAIDILDEILATIRGSKSKKDANTNLINEFGFSELQAEAILEMMLYRLTGLEINVFQKEYKELETTIKKLNKILESEKELLKVIKKEMLQIKESYDDPRRTAIVEDDSEAKIELEELIIEEDVVITLSNEGYIKRTPLKSFNRTSQNVEDIDHREGDFNKFLIEGNTKDTIIFFTSKGNMYQAKGVNIPEFKWKERGERIDTIFKGLDLAEENIISAYSIESFELSRDILFFTSKGLIKKTELSRFNTNYSKLLGIKLKEDETLVKADLVTSDREGKFINVNTRKGLNFTTEEPELQSLDRTVIGKQLFKLVSQDEVISIEYVEEFNYREFYVTLNGKGILRCSNRKSNEKLITIATSTSDLLFFTTKGNVHKIKANLIQNIDKKGVDIHEILENFHKEDPIVSMISVINYRETEGFYFVTSKGMVKKTSSTEFSSDFDYGVACKLKGSEDKVISVYLEENRSDLVVVTKKAMCIRFASTTVNPMGRNAAGVTAISLKDDDEVLFGALIASEIPVNSNSLKDLCIDKYEGTLRLNTIKGEEKTLEISHIPVQNRAGRGKNVMLFSNDDCVEQVEII